MKAKYTESNVLDIVGILDYNDKGELCVMVDGAVYPLMPVLEDRVGTEIQIKAITTKEV